jgi:hypothetical protein
MKKFIVSFALFAIMATLAISVAGQTPAPAQAGGCTDEAKIATYTEFTTHRQSDPAKAYQAAKKYLACSQGGADQYTEYLNKWVAAYEKEVRKLQMGAMLYNEKKYAEALTLGKEIIATEPENLRVIIDLGYGSYLAAATLKQESFNADALTYARRAIQAIEAGKTPAKWEPFKGKDDTLAYLYDVVGRLSLKDSPDAALSSFIKKAQFETDLKKDPWTYYFIAAAYENGPYAKLSADYKTRFEGKDETPESKLALENINQVIDRMVDAYARAVALAGTDAKYATPKKEWMDGLSTWYKYRHNQSDAGLNELIAGVLSKPLPPLPTPITTLPAATPSATPATGANSAAGNGTTTPATTGATVPATKPATTTTTTATPKPKPRKHHGRN